MAEYKATIRMSLSDEGARELKELFDYPHICPLCEFTHPSALWIRKNGVLRCANCNGELVVTFPVEAD